jgi:D-apionolactonase
LSSKNILYYGADEPLPERIPLRAGPLALFYEQGDLRYIKLGDHEILRRIYVAIRDRNWGTIVPSFSDIHLDIQPDSFQITYAVENRHGEINFAWKGEITGDPQGQIIFSMRGEARSTFMRNRIGFCVLHPAACAGVTARLEHVDGQTEAGTFPELICAAQPIPPFAELRALAHQVSPGLWAEVSFTGDIFEMEDQRNWTDASYKTFCTPLRLPFPVQIEAGTRLEQSITLSLMDERAPAAKSASVAIQVGIQPVTFSLQPEKTFNLPRLGLGVASHGQPLNATEISRLKALHLHHLRVDLCLSEPDFVEKLILATAEADALGISLEAALLISDGPKPGLIHLKEAVISLKLPVKTWLVYPLKEIFTGASPTRQVLEAALPYLTGLVPGALIGAGTNTDFIFMQRTPPPLDLIDLVTFAINPQVHAFDNASIVETLEVQGAAVRTARRLAGGKPVIVSPLTLKPPHNPYATEPVPLPPPGELPPQVDPRQMSLLGAGWTAASLKYLAEGGAQSVTCYETTGWRGVMETALGSPLPELFHSRPSCVFPLYHVLADYGEFAGGQAIHSRSSNSLAVDGIALCKEDKTRLILANFSSEPQPVSIQGLGKAALVRALDETNAAQARLNPEQYRAFTESLQSTTDGLLELTLLPYAVVRIDG